MGNIRNAACLAPIALWAFFASDPARAADPNGRGPPDRADIVVTAQKRAQNSNDVPISLAALGADQLDSIQINELRDFVGQVPDLVVNNFNGRPDTVRLFIRGIGQNDVTLTQDPSVGVYVDGIYVGTTVGAAFESEDLERIEVLRGPQGSLYGRNATGGAVNLITAKPAFDGVHARASLSYGNYNERRGTLTFNAQLSETLAVRVTGLVRKRDGLERNTGPGRDFAQVDHRAFRGAVRFRPNAAVTIDYAFDYVRNRDTGTLSVPTQGSPVSFALAPPFAVPGTGGAAIAVTSLVNLFSVPSPFAPQRPRSVRALRPILPNDNRIAAHALTVDYTPSDALTLRSITGLRRIDDVQIADNLPVHEASVVTSVIASTLPQLPVGTILDSIGPNGAAYNSEDVRFRSLSQELQALGRLGEDADYVLGVYYYRDHATQNIVGGGIGSGPLVLRNFTTTRNSAFEAYGEIGLHPPGLGGLSLTLGGRYSHDHRAATRINERSFSFAALGGFTPENCAFFALTFQAMGQTCSPDGQVLAANYNRRFGSFTPSVVLSYRLDPDVNIYVKFVRGYKSGGTSQRSANPVNFAQGFEPEKVSAFEAGLKGRFFDNLLNASIAAFVMRLNNLQASVQTGASPADRDFIGLDRNHFRGIEFELKAAVAQGLSLGLSGALLHTSIGQRSASVLLDTGVVDVEQFIAEQTAAPRTSLATTIDYAHALSGPWSFAAHADLSYQGRTQSSTNLTDNRPIASRALLDCTLDLIRRTRPDRDVSVRFWGRNILNKDYRTINFGAFAFAGAQTGSEFGEPRTYGATLSVRY